MRSAAAIIALLGSLTAGVTVDALFKGANPSGTASQIACATKNQLSGATWTDPASCGVAPSSNIPDSGLVLCGTAPGASAFESPTTCGIPRLTATGTVTSPSAVSAQSCTTSSATATGAAAGDHCEVIPPAAFNPGNLSRNCHVSAANSVVLELCNPTASSVTPTTGAWTLRTFNP